jgi:uncharacterized FAD-dependent dehydrogenase
VFGLPGGVFNDWELKTNLEGLYAAGDQLFASDCHGHAAAQGIMRAECCGLRIESQSLKADESRS